jgi:hypothetical protein
MRLTRENLIKVARDTASQRARISRRVICIYLTGSVLGESPSLGGATDIDLVIIHDDEPLQAREVIRVSDEVHLDIAHYSQDLFRHPRHLRTDPWLGPFIYSKPLVLFDTQHWFDFTQAATGAQFFQPDYVVQRAAQLAQTARQLWIDLSSNQVANHSLKIYELFNVIENAGNALVCLTGEGEPLTERRFLSQLPQRLQALEQPDLTSDLMNLIIPDVTQLEAVWPEWLKNWEAAYTVASSQPNIPPRLNVCRFPYYQRAATALWENSPSAALWPMLISWSQAAGFLPEGAPAATGWQTACEKLQLDEAHFSERLQAVDRYLDRVEETLDAWANANGVSSSTSLS